MSELFSLTERKEKEEKRNESGSTFDLDEFFEAAINRSYSD